MLTGENGILNQAKKASEQTEIAAEKEAISLAYNAAVSKKQGSDVDFTDLNDEFEASDVNAEASGNIVVYFPDTERYYTVENGVVKGPFTEKPETALSAEEMLANGEKCPTQDGTCTDETHLHVGDYVEYKPGNNSPVKLGEAETGYAEEQTFSADASTTWRVLGKDEDGHVLLISGSPIKKSESDPYFIMQGAEAYINCVSTLNKVCSVYNNSSLAIETRSITVEDINRLGGVTVDEEAGEVLKDGTNIDGLGFLKMEPFVYETGDYAPENYMIDKRGADPKDEKINGDTVKYDSYGYMYESLGLNSRVSNMLFAETTDADNFAKSYWLASPGSYIDGNHAYFGPGAVDDGGVCRGSYVTFGSFGVCYARRRAVRPVVVLKSGVSIEKSANQEEHEESWKGKYDNSNSNVSEANYSLSGGSTGRVEATKKRGEEVAE